jgi:DNA modification methylase
MIRGKVRFGDCREIMRGWVDKKIQAQMCVTSPPYWGLRDYKVEGQIGLECTPEEYIAKMVEVFRLVREMLRDDGTLWLNVGDTYVGSRCGEKREIPHWDGWDYDGYLENGRVSVNEGRNIPEIRRSKRIDRGAGRWGGGNNPATGNLKPKDLVGIPWMLAFALRADGWYLRQDIIWSKPNPMPESVRDRCTRAHEYIFLLSKSQRYFYDGDAICQPCKPATIERVSQQNHPNQHGSDRVPGKTNGPMKACFGGRIKSVEARKQTRLQSGNEDNGNYLERGANKRSVWTVTTKPFKGAHFATFPPDLIEPCILAGSSPGDIVLDPFIGSGTTAQVALQHNRLYLGCELNPAYESLINQRVVKFERTEEERAVAAD